MARRIGEFELIARYFAPLAKGFKGARGLMDLSVHNKLAIGYGIVTVDTMEQAQARAFTDRGDKGGDAAHACLAMVALGRRWRNS